ETRCLAAQICAVLFQIFFFSSRRRHTRSKRDWSSDVCSSDLDFSIKEQGFACKNVINIRALGSCGSLKPPARYYPVMPLEGDWLLIQHSLLGVRISRRNYCFTSVYKMFAIMIL